MDPIEVDNFHLPVEAVHQQLSNFEGDPCKANREQMTNGITERERSSHSLGLYTTSPPHKSSLAELPPNYRHLYEKGDSSKKSRKRGKNVSKAGIGKSRRSRKYELSFLLNPDTGSIASLSAKKNKQDSGKMLSVRADSLSINPNETGRNLSVVSRSGEMLRASESTHSSSPQICSGKRQLKFEPIIAVNEYACTVCEERFFDEASCSRHKKAKHGKSAQLFECKECHASFKNPQNLSRHVLLHERKPTTSQGGENNQDDGGHKCAQCSAWFNTQRSLANHMRSHGSEKNGPKKAKRRGRKEGTESFLCNVEGCNYANSQRSNTQRHFQIVHLKWKPYACSKEGCSYKGSTVTNLRAHIQQKHRK